MMNFRKKALVFIQAVSVMLFIGACGLGERKKFPDSPLYNFSAPKVIDLPQVLDEVSGIAYYAKDTSVFAIIDEDGILFKIPLMNPKNIKQWKFDKRRDFEELVMIDSVFYVLISNGDVESIRFEGDSILIDKSDFLSDSKSANEFESMFADKDSARLIIICKECSTDPNNMVSSFVYHFKDSAKSYTNHTRFDMAAMLDKVKADKDLKASAAAVHPVTGEIYLISSIQKLIIIMSPEGEIKEMYELDPGIYKQPEGIAFTPEGDLIISNEFADVGLANLLLLKNKTKGQ